MNEPISGTRNQTPEDIQRLAPTPQLPTTVGGATPTADTLQDPTEGLFRVPGYSVLREIARGGMGVVYAAHDPSFDRLVAIKIMHVGQNSERFVVESRLTGQLPHPGVPPVYAHGTLPDGRPFLVMKLIQGRTLAAELKRSDSTQLPRMLSVLEQIAQTVGFAHSRGIVHRDLKPANVMVGDFGEVLVMDWGLAKELRNADSGSRNEDPNPHSEIHTPQFLETVAGAVKGTPAYMAPEQARGELVDARADVFALGGILAVMLTGHPPFQGERAYATVLKAAKADLIRCFELLDGCGVDRELIALTKRCLAAHRDDRPASGIEVAEVVARYRADVENRLRQAERLRAAAEARAEEERKTREEAAAREVAERARFVESRKRRRAQWALVGAMALLLAAGGVGTAFASLWRTAEELKGIAETEKGRAEQARDELAGQKKLVEIHRDDVAREKEKLAVFEYGRSIQVAYQEWRDNNISSARKILAATRPDLRGWEYDFVYRLCHSELLILNHGDPAGGDGHVARGTFSPDGTRILSVRFDGTAVVSDARTGRKIVTLNSRKDARDAFVRTTLMYFGVPPTGMSYASFSPDGTRIVTASVDNVARVWDAQNGKELTTLQGHTGIVHSVSYSRDGTRIVTASEDKTARVWDSNTGAEITKLQGHTAPVLMASFSGDGQCVITAAQMDPVVRVWDAKTGAEIAKLPGHLGLVYSVSFSPDGTRVVTTHRNLARVWNPKTGAVVATLTGHAGVLTSAAFNPDGKRIITASVDSTARVWDAATGTQLATLRGHQDKVFAASYSLDGKRIVTASFDRTARVWDANTGGELGRLRGHTNQVYSAAFSGDGTRVATASNDTTVRVWLWDDKTGTEGTTFGVGDWHAFGLALETITTASLSPDGMRVVTGNFDGTARVWDARTGIRGVSWKPHLRVVRSASFSPDGTHVATVSDDGTGRVWDARTGATVAILKGHTQGLWSVSYSRDGTRVVTASRDKTARIWDAKTGAIVATCTGHTQQVTTASFSRDGKRIITASYDGTARVWDAQTGIEVAVLQGHTGPVQSAVFSADRSLVVTASNDSTARVWDAGTGATLVILKGHAGSVSSASFSPDDTRVVTASIDGTARVWDAKSGATLAILKGHTTNVYTASFNPEGTRVVTASFDGTTRVWDARTGAELLILKGHTGGLECASSFSADGTRIFATGQRDVSLPHIWDSRPITETVPSRK